MVNICYQDKENAIEFGNDYFQEIEENVYVCSVTYPSGIEYHLKLEKDIVSETNCIKKYEITSKKRFNELKNAIKAISYFKKKGKRMQVKKHFETTGGYKFVKYYYLCSL